ncbi:alpha/beta hydrolase-fold protein [Aquirufa sp. 2-AUSEE-184A6]|uniref:Alpha/beta hydrolase-fold protein n=1 Tax=Aquirufa novilacunae TaxID=3139305 RepID=A0ABW8SZF3_9BACT
MKKLLVIGVLFLSQTLFAQHPLTKDMTAKFELNSKSNNTKYTLEVSLPETYTPSKKYPVYYILDGYYAAGIAHGAHRTLMFEKLIEDVIVVTITGPEKTTSEWLINRWSDYTFSADTLNDVGAAKIFNLPAGSLHSGKGYQFLESLTKEIFPLIETKYSFNGQRGISGHSLGGQYVAYLMFNSAILFNRFGINSSSQRLWLNNEIIRVESKYAETHKEFNGRVFLSFGGLEPKNAIEDLRYFDNQLISHYKNIETKFVEFPEETHASVMSAMLSRCMLYLYKK